MSFLRCKPSVFVVGNQYEVLINLNAFGLCYVQVGEQVYYENNSGVLPSERLVVKIRIPQSVLDKEKCYEIIFRETDARKSYFSTFKPMQKQEFSFKPLEKEKDINVYHIADVHYKFDEAKKVAGYFGNNTDVFVVNGDIGEVETEENFLEVCEFVGEISNGEIPVIFVRGNHDTRGRLAELYSKYFPVENGKTYFDFSIGCLNGVALDCGEDKPDTNKEYDATEGVDEKYCGINRFHSFREEQLEFLKRFSLQTKDKITFAISHVCPVMATEQKNSIFDIERDLYEKWNNELEKIGIKFMLCGHYHTAFILSPKDERCLILQSYPVVVGSACLKEQGLLGAAIVLNKDKMLVNFTDKFCKIVESHEIKL